MAAVASTSKCMLKVIYWVMKEKREYHPAFFALNIMKNRDSIYKGSSHCVDTKKLGKNLSTGILCFNGCGVLFMMRR